MIDGEPSSPMRDNDEYLSDEEVIEKQPEFEEGLILKQGYLLKKNHNLKVYFIFLFFSLKKEIKEI